MLVNSRRSAVGAAALTTFGLIGLMLVSVEASPAAATTVTWYVSMSAASDPTCTAGAAGTRFATIAGVMDCAGNGDTVSVGPGTFAGGFTLFANVTLKGASAATTIITGASGNSRPTVTVYSNVSPVIKNLTVDGATQYGGIVAGAGSLTLLHVAVVNTVATANIPGTARAALDIEPTSGTSTVTVKGSTFANNVFGAYGAIAAIAPTGGSAAVTVTNSTIVNNQGNAGGAIAAVRSQIVLRDDTLVGNFALSGGGLSVDSHSTATVTDTILANTATNAITQDCNNMGTGTVVSGGHNLVSVAAPTSFGDCGFSQNVRGDQTGSVAAPLNPMLSALATNGGSTPTMASLPGSPARNAGNPSDCGATPINNLDQRGLTRNATTRNTCDIGAYDSGGTGVVTWTVAAGVLSDPTCAAGATGTSFATVAGALACAVNGDVVSIGAGTFAGGFTIGTNVTVKGVSATSTTISGVSAIAVPLIAVNSPGSVIIKNLKVNGKAHDGGIVAGAGSLTLLQLAVVNTVSVASGSGSHAAVDVNAGSGTVAVTVKGSTIANNVLGTTGGVQVSSPPNTALSTLAVSNSTIASNSGLSSGAFSLFYTAATLRDVTAAGNSSQSVGGLLIGSGSTASLTDTILVNRASMTALPDCQRVQGANFTSGGHNVVGAAAAGNPLDCGFVNGVNGDQAGSIAAPLNPKLGALALHGGSTQTMALLTGSPAHNAGNPGDCRSAPINNLDQRGVGRNAAIRNACDVGAYDTGVN